MGTRQRLRFSVEHIILIRNQFKLVDKDGDLLINREEFRTLFRSFGQIVSNKRLDWIVNEVFKNIDGRGIDFDTFINAFVSYYSPPPTERAVREALLLFDEKFTGYIDKTKLAELLTSRGEKLTREEVDYFFDVVGIEKEMCKIDYTSLVESTYKLLSHIPLSTQ